MTKKEAIDYLLLIKMLFDNNYVHEALDIAIEELSTENVPQLRQTDTIIIATALQYLIDDTERHELDRARAKKLREQYLLYGAKMKGGNIE